ncbi:tyrosine-type recombinase/integrase [Methylomonas sp. SURF-2]|uniref:Tyrosine-type recombinase/integrase n=1 Tax=Methylomonas subterranea TaxID=2952225 RepID=A0ABT1TJ74_9GAMM|nr:tyrosine-type recombinase/integrase [Methylomonas sp. SURF-2]MCQ8105532.1 tyrosine-type recombinase/integrase [Methylomonas sp. SURF-2]
MAIKQDKDGTWRVQIDRKGMPRTRRTGFTAKGDAELFERNYLAEYRVNHEQAMDGRTLKELIESWFIYHGINLADGERRRRALLQMASDLKNPVASQLTAEQFLKYRYQKTFEGDVVCFKTFNNLHGYLAAVFNKLKKLKVITYQSPICDIDFIKVQERQLSYLSRKQIDELLEVIRIHAQNLNTWWVTQICLRTGARWSEAEKLKRKQLRDGRITFEFTKSKKTRTVPLDPAFFHALDQYAGYLNPDDRIFTNCIGSFRRAAKHTSIDFPQGQKTHILRHSFASHFVMNGGNILSLQKILGHADISMTMRYAHLAPDHLKDAIKLNPLANTVKLSADTFKTQ